MSSLQVNYIFIFIVVFSSSLFEFHYLYLLLPSKLNEAKSMNLNAKFLPWKAALIRCVAAKVFGKVTIHEFQKILIYVSSEALWSMQGNKAPSLDCFLAVFF